MGAPPNVKKGAAQTGARGVVTDGAKQRPRPMQSTVLCLSTWSLDVEARLRRRTTHLDGEEGAFLSSHEHTRPK